jgi:hypothetical protein
MAHHKPTPAAKQNIQRGRPDRATPTERAVAQGIAKPDPALSKRKGTR